MTTTNPERERIARIISGAPFPSKRSYAKADAILTTGPDGLALPALQGAEPAAWRRRPKGSDRGWTLFPNDDPAEVLFYQTNGRYDVEPLYAAPVEALTSTALADHSPDSGKMIEEDARLPQQRGQ